MIVAYIAVGSNLGDREKHLRGAVHKLANLDGVRMELFAHTLETAPVGGPAGQPPFLNTVCKVTTSLAARALLDGCLKIERLHGRDRAAETERWGPRVIDLDLLLYGDAVIEEEGLRVPHPEMHRRLFVLRPLCEIAPGARHPVLHRTVGDLLESLEQDTDNES